MVMHLNNLLLPRQSGVCIVCPAPLPCNCAANEDCIQINRDCNTCSSFTCTPNNTPSTSHSTGVGTGALAGAVIGSLVFLGAAIALFCWYRQNVKARKIKAGLEGKIDIPAPAETVLNRPNPNEKLPPAKELSNVRLYARSSDTTIDLDPQLQRVSATQEPHGSHRSSSRSNPFEDNNSIQTAGTEGTNVIPIALVSPASDSAISTETGSSTGSPARPARTPDLNLNLDHVNVSRDSLQQPSTQLQGSGTSVISSRNSYMSNASYSSDFLNEAPTIVTPTKGAVRQVVGVVKAEVIKAHPLTPATSEGLRTPGLSSRPSVGSPLAARSFGPADMIRESDDGQTLSVHSNPFGDEHSPPPSPRTITSRSPAASATTFGTSSRITANGHGSVSEWSAPEPIQPWNQASGNSSRPTSISTQAGSIADIGSATRVNVGLNTLSPGYASYAVSSTPLTANSFPRSTFRTTMGRLVTPPSNNSTGTLEEQQQRALDHAQARAQAQGIGRRVSGSSVVSSVSTRADSILEAFPFVPPSPISDRPVRSPPCSPLTKQTFNEGTSAKDPNEALLSPALNPAPVPVPPPAPQSQLRPAEPHHPDVYPPNRGTLALSVASQISTASTGLGSFPFQIDSGNSSDASPLPSAFKDRQRASLDTLALTSDLTSYPLGFDRDPRESFTVFQKR